MKKKLKLPTKVKVISDFKYKLLVWWRGGCIQFVEVRFKNNMALTAIYNFRDPANSVYVSNTSAEWFMENS
jgi:hypothetical protein